MIAGGFGRAPSVLLFRPGLDIRSGAGQLMQAQAEGLEAAGESVQIAGERGCLRFLLRSGRRARHMHRSTVNQRAAAGESLVVDHGGVLENPHLVFVHNLFAEAVRFQPREDWVSEAAREAAYFRRLDPATVVVANSERVRAGLLGHFQRRPDTVRVHYPGINVQRFNAAAAPRLRATARAMLKLKPDTLLLGFVTSGDLAKRGLHAFAELATRLLQVRDDLHFLVVGEKRLPELAAIQALHAAGRLSYRAKSSRPQLWMAALDLFVYAADFEEFGMVVAEAQALGIPLLVSRRVGATECLPSAYDPWLLEQPDAAALLERALVLLDNPQIRRDLATAAQRSATGNDMAAYALATIATIRAQKPRLR